MNTPRGLFLIAAAVVLSFLESRERVSGTYANNSGSFTGLLDTHWFEGQWKDSTGSGTMRIYSMGDKVAGEWKRETGNGPRTGTWGGKCEWGRHSVAAPPSLKSPSPLYSSAIFPCTAIFIYPTAIAPSPQYLLLDIRSQQTFARASFSGIAFIQDLTFQSKAFRYAGAPTEWRPDIFR